MIFDIIIIATQKDFHKIKYLYDSIIQNITAYNQIYCFCPEYPSEKIEGIEYVLDRDVLNIDMSIVKFRPTWIYQQYLKLLQKVTLSKYLVIDTDIIINKQISIFDKEIPNFFFLNNTISTPFFNYSKLMFGIDKEYIQYSFISEMMLFDRDLIKEMIYSKFTDYKDFIIGSNSVITNKCFISEYELYGNYIFKNHRDEYNYKKITTPTMINVKSWSKIEIEEYITKYKNSNFDILRIPTLE